MNLIRGFRRITFCFAIFAAIAGFIIGLTIAKSEIHIEIERVKSVLQKYKTGHYDLFCRILAEDNVAEAQNIKLTEMGDEAREEWETKYKREIEKETALIKLRQIANTEKNFWLNLSAGRVLGISVLAGIGGAAAGFAGTWVILWYGSLAIFILVGWLILGFADENPKDEQKQ